jgi:raffinose/stachyose/melibiose transport system permease protein
MSRRGAGAGQHVLLIVFALLTLSPLVLLLSTMFKTRTDVLVDPFGLFTSFSLENLSRAWTEGHFNEYLANSVFVAVPSTMLVLVLSTLAGYAFARLPFPGRSVAFYTVVLGLLVPFFAYMIPLYFQLRSMHLLDTLAGLILVMTASGVAFGTFFMRAFFMDLPYELEQAARLDGASEWQIFHRVMLPMTRSGLAALAVFTFLEVWNNFLIPLLYMPSGRFRPLTTALYQFTGGRELDIGPLAAATFITIVPVLILFVTLQRQVADGFAGALKG